jgi:hypothetical protein
MYHFIAKLIGIGAPLSCDKQATSVDIVSLVGSISDKAIAKAVLQHSARCVEIAWFNCHNFNS